MRWTGLMVLAACSSGSGGGDTTISFDGAGRGFVRNDATGELCEDSCVIASEEASAGDAPSAQLRLTAFALSQLGGWTGCDEVMGDTCVVAAERAHDLRVAFERDEHEVATLTPPFPITTGAFAEGGFVLASPQQIARVDAAAQPIWTVQPGAVAVRVAPSGDVYALRAATVARFDAAGAPRWERSIGAASMDLLPGGDVALATADAVTVLAAADGSVLWTRSAPLAQSIAVRPQGEIAVGTGNAVILRFDRDGAALADRALPQTGASQVAFDAAGHLHAQVVRFEPSPTDPGGFRTQRTIVRYDDAGGVADTDTDEVTQTGSGFAVGAGRLAWRHLFAFFHTTTVDAGAYLEASDASGAPAWTLSKITRGSIGNGSSVLSQQVQVTDAACDGASRCAVFGTYLYSSGQSRLPWMEILTVP
ncbi:MAG TPA: hypothetical protein VNO30_13865 [Kofleriaceae bacterium]|nr:hypothetical protein [Kofleriaceae bacterium]